jgi:hypothetical protein
MSNLTTLDRVVSDFIAQPHERLTTSALNTLMPDYVRLQDTVRASMAKADTIQRDRSLSDEGKQKAKAKMANEHIDNYSFIGGRRTNNAERIRNLHATNYAAVLDVPQDSDSTKALIRELRAGEIRSLHRNAENRDSVFLTALEHGHLETVHALLNAPDGSWVSPDIRQRGAELYASRNTPKEYAALMDAFSVRGHFDMLAEVTRSAFTALGGDPERIAKVLKVQS